jgi:hypothetical protein
MLSSKCEERLRELGLGGRFGQDARLRSRKTICRTLHKVSISTSLPLTINGSERCEALLGSSVIGADGGGWGEGRGPSDPLDCSFGIAGEEGLNAPAR